MPTLVMPLARHPAVPYVAPFLAFVGILALENVIPLSPDVLYTARFLVVAALTLVVSRPLITFRATQWVPSILVGLLVFVIWVAPDVLWPGYRGHWLFTNSITGAAQTSLPAHARLNPWFLAIRMTGCVLLVPVLEEIFWRGWLMRWLIHQDFEKVALGACTRSAFLIVTVLFASEHGPYWDVGLAAGAIYNWWIMRTKSLGDVIVAHAVTNGALSVYVLATEQWQYWL